MKQKRLERSGGILFLIISYCLWAAVSLRWITEFIEGQHPLTWAITAILLLFGLLIGIEPLLTAVSPLLKNSYLTFQTIIIFLASLLYFELDFFALLYVIIGGQAMFLFSKRGQIWVAILIAMTAIGQIIQFGIPIAFSFILLYSAALVFVAAFVRMVLRAEDARQHSDHLLAELQQAHAQLQDYAGQAEELAIANERTRLARDLHDSVAQTLYGLTLQAEAASRKLTAGKTDEVEGYLDEIKTDAQQTLQETRLLIYELRPPILESSGLSAALKARLETVEVRSGLQMNLNLEEITGLSPTVETGLYRIAQEALNNAARYASANRLHVSLYQKNGAAILEITDDGIGFDKSAVPPGRVGLKGMAERVEQMNGRLNIETAPNKGTKIHVEVPL